MVKEVLNDDQKKALLEKLKKSIEELNKHLVLDDNFLFSNTKIENKAVDKLHQLTTIIGDTTGDNLDKVHEFTKCINPKIMTYMFRLSIINCGYAGLSKVSKTIIELNKDQILDYRFLFDKKLVPYYRYFAKFNDYGAIGYLFDKRGINEADADDFKCFINGLSSEQYEEFLNGLEDGDYEKVFHFRAHNK